MINEYGSNRQLSSGALKFLTSFKITDSKRNIYVNFILQIYKCTPLLHNDYFSCTLFDKENLCNTFVLKYDKREGRPYPGDIISVTKINVSILGDGEHVLYTCEEIKLLERNKKFLINPEKLLSISSKLKLEKNNLYNNTSSKKQIKSEEKKNLESNSKNIIYEENLSQYDSDLSNAINFNNSISISSNINIIDNTSSQKKIKNENQYNSSKKTVKIMPQKKEDLSEKEKELILDSINLFIDDFKDGIEEEPNNNNSNKNTYINNSNIIINNNNSISNIKNSNNFINVNGKSKSNNLSKNDYSLLGKRSIKISTPIKNQNQINNKLDIQYKYISEINQILSKCKDINNDIKYKIRCQIDNFEIGKNIIYKGCSICKKIINNKDKICCRGGYEKYLYSFSVTVKDPSGKCKVYFNDIQGSSFMEIDAEIFNNYINDETSMGRIIFSNYKNNFFENQYVISLISLEDIYRKEKKYEVIEVERLGKKHRYELLKELKNILM